MKHTMAFFLLPALSMSVTLPAYAAETCAIELVSKAGVPPDAWISQDNWLTPEYLRAGLQSPGRFMPSKKIGGLPAPAALKRELTARVDRWLADPTPAEPGEPGHS